jgi:hypothetical protein
MLAIEDVIYFDNAGNRGRFDPNTYATPEFYKMFFELKSIISGSVLNSSMITDF